MKKLFPLLIPGFVYQSIIVAGGYGTGQELSVFFIGLGPYHGLLALVLIPIPVISLCALLCFEVSRLYEAYDYRDFFRVLLGRAWFVWEIVFLVALALFLGIVSSATGEIFAQTFGVERFFGVAFLIAMVALIVFGGNRSVERVLSFWSLVLYATFGCFFILAYYKFGNAIPSAFSVRDAGLISGEKWYIQGIAYAGLQLSMLPVVVFTIRRIHTRRQSVAAAMLLGPIAIIPGILFFLIMLTHYPAIREVVLPSNYLLESIGIRWFQVFFQVVLVGTLIETGAGVIHAFNERVNSVYRSRNREMPGRLRPLIAIVIMLTAVLLTNIGLVGLVRFAAGVFSWLFVAVFVLPLLLFGPRLILKREKLNKKPYIAKDRRTIN